MVPGHHARMDCPATSFIVPAHNEAPLLGATLDAIAVAIAVLALEAEVVVVDDASSDDTAFNSRHDSSPKEYVANGGYQLFGSNCFTRPTSVS